MIILEGKMLKFLKFAPSLSNSCFYRCSSSYAKRYRFNHSKPISYPKLGSSNDIKRALVPEKSSVSRPTYSNDYYKILGVPKNASIQKIKEAYYRLAKQFHPDANRTPQEHKSFQEISDAYHVLSDEAIRQEYDLNGMVRNNRKHASVPGDKPIRERVKPHYPAAGRNHGKKNNQPPTLEDAVYASYKGEIEVKVEFLTAVFGSKEYIDLNTMVTCPDCRGSSKLIGQQNIELCEKCGGTGEAYAKDIHQNSKVCELCNGDRYLNKISCHMCSNRGYIVRSRQVELIIPPGTSTGDILRVTNPLTNQVVKFVIDVEENKHFKREGNNIFTTKYITISQAVLGGKLKIRGLYEELELNLCPGVESHTKHCFKGKGIIAAQGEPGDHTVTFKIRIPRNLTTKQRQLILALARTEDPSIDGMQ